jgi:hypothetical protein
MLLKKLVFLSYILLSPLYLFSQSESPDYKGSTSLLFHLGVPELVGLEVNHYLNNRLSINLGLGFTLNCHAGSNFYLVERSHSPSSVYTGFQLVLYNDSYVLGGEGEKWRGIYIPIGYEYVGRKGLTFQLDLGPCFFERKYFASDTPSTYFFCSIKIGKTIKRKTLAKQ